MSLSLQAVLFDLDGTLLDTAPDFVAAINHVRQEDGLPTINEEAIVQHISHGAEALIQAVYHQHPGNPEYEPLKQRLLAQYERTVSAHTRLFPQLDELLHAIETRRLPWGIVTNKHARFANPLLRALGLAERCQTLICPDHVTCAKPHPEPMHLACQHLKVTPAHCLYIGDHQRDIQAGKAAGMATMVAAYGYLNDDDSPTQWHADAIAYQPSDILHWLKLNHWSVHPSALSAGSC